MATLVLFLALPLALGLTKALGVFFPVIRGEIRGSV